MSRHRLPPCPPRRPRGLTLIELMISVTLGLMLVSAMVYLYAGSRGTYRGNRSLARLQESGRFGLDAILRDLRAVGDIGCGARIAIGTSAPAGLATTTGTSLSLPGDAGVALPFTGPASALFGVAASGYQFPVAKAQPTTTFKLPSTVVNASGAPSWYAGDVMQMVVPAGPAVPLVANPDTTGNKLSLADNGAGQNLGGIQVGDYLLVSNCTQAVLVHVGSVSSSGSPYVVGFDANWPANPMINLGLATHPSVQRIDAVTYFVGNKPGLRPWPPSLYRVSLSRGVEEVVDHVENMSVEYAVPQAAPAPATSTTDWAHVASVRVGLQVVGDEAGAVNSAQVVVLPPTTATHGFAAPDTRLRQVYTATAALRERLP